MSKAISITFRDTGHDLSPLRQQSGLMARWLNPDNLTGCHPTKVVAHKGHISFIFNPMPSIKATNNSFCLGKMVNEKQDWWKPLGSVPHDGSYTLFRADGRFVECINDNVGYRTIWYYFDKDMFISSTSQRAIIMLLGSFVPNPAVVPWMLSSGTLGFGNAWDKRVQKLEANSQLLLDRHTWEISTKKYPITFTPPKIDRVTLKKELAQSIESVFADLNCHPNHWKIPLSGGFDSRAVLLASLGEGRPETITWGEPGSRETAGTDAYIACQLAKAMEVKNDYHAISGTDTSTETIIDRFLKAGEGRTDHISGYLDGMALWKGLFDSGVHGIIRGDQALGCNPVSTVHDVYKDQGLQTLSCFKNLGCFAGLMGDLPQEIPNCLLQKEGESLQRWWFRLYTSFRAPTVVAALNDIKLSYVEVVSPLFSRSIIEKVIQIPDRLMEGKVLFKEWVRETGPDVPFARKGSTISLKAFARDKQAYQLINDQLHSASTYNSLPKQAALYISANMDKPLKWHFLFEKAQRLRHKFDRSAKNRPEMDMNILGFRAYIVSRMHGVLEEDARILQSNFSVLS